MLCPPSSLSIYPGSPDDFVQQTTRPTRIMVALLTFISRATALSPMNCPVHDTTGRSRTERL
jgi:hypothetical protein